jgi:hypothetical protein
MKRHLRAIFRYNFTTKRLKIQGKYDWVIPAAFGARKKPIRKKFLLA